MKRYQQESECNLFKFWLCEVHIEMDNHKKYYQILIILKARKKIIIINIFSVMILFRRGESGDRREKMCLMLLSEV